MIITSWIVDACIVRQSFVGGKKPQHQHCRHQTGHLMMCTLVKSVRCYVVVVVTALTAHVSVMLSITASAFFSF